MRKPTNDPTRLHADCTLGVMAAVGLAWACGLAAYGPIPMTDAWTAGRSMPPGARALASLLVAAAALWGLARARGPFATRPWRPADPLQALSITALAWASVTAVRAWHDAEALWVVSQGLGSAACLLLLAIFVGEAFDARWVDRASAGCSALLAALAPLAWWLGVGSSGLGDARWMLATQAIALAMLFTGAVHHGTRAPRSRAAAYAGACLAGALGVEWVCSTGLATGSAAALAWLQPCCVAVGFGVVSRGRPGSAGATQAPVTAAAPSVVRADVDLSLTKQRMAS